MSIVVSIHLLKEPGHGSTTIGDHEFVVLPRVGELVSVQRVSKHRYFRVVEIFHDFWPKGVRDPAAPDEVFHDIHMYVREDSWLFNY